MKKTIYDYDLKIRHPLQHNERFAISDDNIDNGIFG